MILINDPHFSSLPHSFFYTFNLPIFYDNNDRVDGSSHLFFHTNKPHNKSHNCNAQLPRNLICTKALQNSALNNNLKFLSG